MKAGTLPQNFKEAYVGPLLKKTSLHKKKEKLQACIQLGFHS